MLSLSPARSSCSARDHVTMTFLGTRGEIDLRSRRHRRHSALLIHCGATRVMMDCGADWPNLLVSVLPTAIVLTHAHPDHAGGLAHGAPCPVYATSETLALLRRCSIQDSRTVAVRTPERIGELSFEAFPVEHSMRAPAVGYRIVARRRCLFYVPDVAAIRDRHAALEGVHLYIGDGATIRRPLTRRRGRVLIGHAPIVEQLAWCKQAGIRQAMFTHCGSQIVRGDARQVGPVVRRLGEELGINAALAHDGLSVCFG
jgi:phosphoribosyl 1,2-cyclic phosphodiesterase